MPSDCISYQSSGYFTKLITGYLNQEPAVQPLYNRFPTVENFKLQIEEKQKKYLVSHRAILASELKKQYINFEPSAATLKNIDLLEQENSFTITTGHQLNLFTGPLYFLYKIVSAINLSKQLKAAYPEYNFVPVYWMATEDHDFEEINHFNFKDKKIKWNKQSSGPVGRLNTKGLDELLAIFSQELGVGKNSQKLHKLFKNAYLKHNNLSDATRYLASEIFKAEGLVIIDADSPDLKKLFIPFIQDELLYQTAHKKVSETSERLKEYNVQVKPREINLFYIEDNLRERIILKNDTYHVNNTSLQFSEKELLELLHNNPEKFSPNVIMRPLYQEVILPNLCYIGGGGEIAYWLELKSYFEACDVTFPVLLLRNGALLATDKQQNKKDKLQLTWQDLFKKQQDLLNEKTKDFSLFNIDFSEHKNNLKAQFKKLHEIAQKTDRSFTGAVKAQEAKQIKGLENLEKRLLKAERKKHSDTLERIKILQNELFPSGGLQERRANFSEFYLEYGDAMIAKLLIELQPLQQNFNIIVL